MANNNYQYVLSPLSIAASGSFTIDVDRYNLHFLMVLATVTYAQTGSNPNLLLTVYDGFGSGDNNSNYSTGLPVVIGGSAIPKYNTVGKAYPITGFNLLSNVLQEISKSIRFETTGSNNKCSRWIRMVFQNQDSKACTLELRAMI